MEGLTLEGRLALVTGGAGGIGSQIVADLTSLGATVGVCDINEEQAKSVASQNDRALALGVDLSDRDSISAMIETARAELGHVDVLVNNAGWDSVGPFVDSSPEVWDRLIAINLRAPVQLTHAFLPGMQEAGWGRLVFVSSDAARVGSSGEAVYAACKAGMIGFGKTIARESARRGVTSNVVCPGPTQTPLLEDIAAGNEKLVEALRRSVPLGRLGQPRDVAGVIAFLCSERAEYLTGQTISVSGGLTMV
jgi:2-hydroxycyclohexanecarboxyl-CoA dehydrogenase